MCCHSLQLCRKGVTLSYLHSVAVDLLAGQMKGELNVMCAVHDDCMLNTVHVLTSCRYSVG